MTELTDQEKKEISIILDKIELKVKEIKPACKNQVQKDIVKEVEIFLKAHRK